MARINRRTFLRETGSAAAAVVAAPAVSTTLAANSPNDTIRIGIIGVRSVGRGSEHLKEWPKIKNVEIAAVCDIDEREIAKALTTLDKMGQKKPKGVWDLRRILDDKEIDAISIAAPDHWHALATIWGCQAGKDVYVEKPTSHNIWEGRKMVEAARKYNRIVQSGMQNRSLPAVRAAMKFLHEGGIGDVYMAKGLCFKPRDTIGKKPNGPVPEGVHYDQWLGPAPLRPFNENRFHYTWHWFWDYGCTDLGNQGPHQMDIARWGMNKHDFPVRIHCAGGYFVFDSDQETPNTQISTLEFADGKVLQFEVRGLHTNAEDGITIGNLFYGSKGWMHLDGNTWKTYFGRKNEPGPSSESKDAGADPMNLAGAASSPHFANFIQAVRSRKVSDQNADIEEGHRSTSYCHLSNIAYRLKRQLQFDSNLECFVNDAQADGYLSRKYRHPFVVPEKV